MTTPIPQPPGIPLLGNIFDINPSNTWASLKILAEKYGEQIKSFSVVPRSGPISLLINGDSLTLRLGEIFQVKVLGKTIVFVAGAALAGELCDEKRFRKFVGGPIVEIRHTVHDSLFTAFDHEASPSRDRHPAASPEEEKSQPHRPAPAGERARGTHRDGYGSHPRGRGDPRA